jgi:hypothetical protein
MENNMAVPQKNKKIYLKTQQIYSAFKSKRTENKALNSYLHIHAH